MGDQGPAAASAAPEPEAGSFEGAEWAKDRKYDHNINLSSFYQRHGPKYCTKMLSRIRMLHYIKQEIISDLEVQVNAGVKAAILPIQLPSCKISLTPWWDAQADVSLLVGTYKHGYERYDAMRLDPSLCFLDRCGPPDQQELLPEMVALEADSEEFQKAQENVLFPPASKLNAHLRLITSIYQREKKEKLASISMSPLEPNMQYAFPGPSGETPAFFLSFPEDVLIPTNLGLVATKPSTTSPPLAK